MGLMKVFLKIQSGVLIEVLLPEKQVSIQVEMKLKISRVSAAVSQGCWFD